MNTDYENASELGRADLLREYMSLAARYQQQRQAARRVAKYARGEGWLRCMTDIANNMTRRAFAYRRVIGRLVGWMRYIGFKEWLRAVKMAKAKGVEVYVVGYISSEYEAAQRYSARKLAQSRRFAHLLKRYRTSQRSCAVIGPGTTNCMRTTETPMRGSQKWRWRSERGWHV